MYVIIIIVVINVIYMVQIRIDAANAPFFVDCYRHCSLYHQN